MHTTESIFGHHQSTIVHLVLSLFLIKSRLSKSWLTERVEPMLQYIRDTKAICWLQITVVLLWGSVLSNNVIQGLPHMASIHLKCDWLRKVFNRKKKTLFATSLFIRCLHWRWPKQSFFLATMNVLIQTAQFKSWKMNICSRNIRCINPIDWGSNRRPI